MTDSPENIGLLIKVLSFAWIVLGVPLKIWYDRMEKLADDNKDLRADVEIKHADSNKRISDTQLHLANKYHNKDDLSDLLDAKINPIVDTLKDIKGIVNRRDIKRDSDI